MDQSIFEWYEEKARALKVDPYEVVYSGKFIRPLYCVNDKYLFEGVTYYSKQPHSKDYKIFVLSRNFSKSVTSRDNELSTASELIGEKKYKAFKFLTAKHFVLHKNSSYCLVSPDLFVGDFQKYSYFDLATGNRIRSYEKSTKATISDRFSDVLTKKDLYLEYMTEYCYEQYISFILNRIFEFSDDDHESNVIFVKSKNSKKFENMFICDKESTVFNFMLANGMDYDSIKYALMQYNNYSGLIINSAGVDEFELQLNKIISLFDGGLLGEAQLEILKQIAELDYDKIAEEVLDGTGIKKNQQQIDLYKFGSEKAGEIAERIK